MSSPVPTATVTGRARIRCPFCRGWFMPLDGALGVVHSEPFCDHFRRLDPLAFVIAARRAFGLPAAADDAD